MNPVLEGRPVGLDQLLDRLEATIGRLADGRAPLEELVDAHEEAVRLVAEARLQVEELAAWAAPAGVVGAPKEARP